MKKYDKATEQSVASLHGQLNELYTKIANTLSVALDSEDSDERLMAINLTSPALLTSMTNWIKHNNVTCSPGDTDDFSELHRQLADKRKRRKGVQDVSYGDDPDEIELQ